MSGEMTLEIFLVRKLFAAQLTAVHLGYVAPHHVATLLLPASSQ